MSRRKFVHRWTALTAATALPMSTRLSWGNHSVTQSISGLAYGTSWSLILDKAEYVSGLRQSIERALEDIDKLISPFRSDSTITAFNRSETGETTKVNAEFMHLVQASVAISNLSNGAFDPTVGPMVNRFGFGPIKGSKDCIYTDIEWETLHLIKRKSGLTLDFCGLGKGYALDIVSDSLRKLGLQNFLLELGGEFAAIGRHPSGRQWNVAIELPTQSIRTQPIIGLNDMCIATSGLTHNYFNANGFRYGHLIDARKQKTAAAQCHSVSVLHTSAMLADAWATALYVAGPDSGYKLAQTQGLSALFLAHTDNQQDTVGTGLFNNGLMQG